MCLLEEHEWERFLPIAGPGWDTGKLLTTVIMPGMRTQTRKSCPCGTGQVSTTKAAEDKLTLGALADSFPDYQNLDLKGHTEDHFCKDVTLLLVVF